MCLSAIIITASLIISDAWPKISEKSSLLGSNNISGREISATNLEKVPKKKTEKKLKKLKNKPQQGLENFNNL